VGVVGIEDVESVDVCDVIVAVCLQRFAGTFYFFPHLFQCEADRIESGFSTRGVDRRDESDRCRWVLFSDDLDESHNSRGECTFIERSSPVDVDSNAEGDEIGFTISDKPGDHRIEMALPPESKTGEIVSTGAGDDCWPCFGWRVGSAAVSD